MAVAVAVRLLERFAPLLEECQSSPSPQNLPTMSTRMTLTLVEIVTLQAVLGLPVILGAVACTGYYMRTHQQKGSLFVVAACVAMGVAAVPMATAIWAHWPFETDIMVAGFVNVPAIAACSVLTPAALWVAGRSAKGA